MSASQPAPTSRQLSYLRALAAKTASTFVTPATRGEASREISRLRELADTRAVQPREPWIDAGHLTYATAVQEYEVSGFGSSATWRPAHLPTGERATRPRETSSASGELSRYRLSGGEERVVSSERVEGSLRLTDRPRSGEGRSYLIERDLQIEGSDALKALLADYLTQARELDEVPMAASAISQLLGAGSGA
jgi:hypothetical protein